MKETIKDIIIQSAWMNLKDCSLVSPETVSVKLSEDFIQFFSWYRAHSFEFEYYISEDVYKYWKNNVKDA